MTTPSGRSRTKKPWTAKERKKSFKAHHSEMVIIVSPIFMASRWEMSRNSERCLAFWNERTDVEWNK